MRPFDAIVLLGGSGRRLGGMDKAAIRVGETTLLERALAAVDDAGTTVCVGPARPTARPVRWTIEDPAGGGPVAGIEAGLAYVAAPVVVVVAVDMPFVKRALIEDLVRACEKDGAMVKDDSVQPLLAAYATGILRSRLEVVGSAGVSMTTLVAGMSCELVSAPGAAFDVDTLEDLDSIRKTGGSK